MVRDAALSRVVARFLALKDSAGPVPAGDRAFSDRSRHRVRPLATRLGAGLLLVGLLAACAETSGGADSPQGSVPPELVGAWCGGSNAGSHDTWIFEPDGEFVAQESVALSGVARVEGDQLTLFTNEMGEQQRTVSLEVDPVIGPVLYLDGYSYLPGEC